MPDPLQEVTESLEGLDTGRTSVENSSSGEIVSTEPEPFERLPSPSSRGATPQPESRLVNTETVTEEGEAAAVEGTMADSAQEVQPEEVAPAQAPARESPPQQPEPEVEREPPIVFKDELDVSTGVDDDGGSDNDDFWSYLLPGYRSGDLSPCLSLSASSSCSDLFLASSPSSSSSSSSPFYFYSSSSSSSSCSSLSSQSSSSTCSSSSSYHSSSQSSSHSSVKNSSCSSKSEDSDINNNLSSTSTRSTRVPTPELPQDIFIEEASSNSNTSPSTRTYHTPMISPSLSRSSTTCSDLSMCSSTSGLSFGSSYYILYVVDPVGRVPTPQELPSSPENSPSPPLLSRSNSVTSIATVDTMRTVTPDQQYFEVNNAAFRRMHGISRASSYESCLSWRSRSHSLSFDSCSTLNCKSQSQGPPPQFLLSPIPHSPQPTPSPVTRSQPSSPVGPKPAPPSRAYSLESISSFLRRLPRAPSSIRSISTFEFAPSTCSTTPPPRGEEFLDRPPSTDSPILLASPNGSLRGSHDSLVVYRPVPRYSHTDLGSPEPQSALLCYLGPARPYEPPVVYTSVVEQVGICSQLWLLSRLLCPGGEPPKPPPTYHQSTSTTSAVAPLTCMTTLVLLLLKSWLPYTCLCVEWSDLVDGVLEQFIFVVCKSAKEKI